MINAASQRVCPSPDSRQIRPFAGVGIVGIRFLQSVMFVLQVLNLGVLCVSACVPVVLGHFPHGLSVASWPPSLGPSLPFTITPASHVIAGSVGAIVRRSWSPLLWLPYLAWKSCRCGPWGATRSPPGHQVSMGFLSVPAQYCFASL